MTFNEENTIENALREHLSQRRTDEDEKKNLKK